MTPNKRIAYNMLVQSVLDVDVLSVVIVDGKATMNEEQWTNLVMLAKNAQYAEG